MDTEIQVATSSGVLDQAGKVVRPRLAASTLQDRVDVTAPTQDILEIRVRAPTSHDAIALSNAVANSYVDYSTNASTKRAKQLVAGLAESGGAIDPAGRRPTDADRAARRARRDAPSRIGCGDAPRT